MNPSGESGRAMPGNKLIGLWKSFPACATTPFSFFKEFHLCMRVTRVYNDSGVVWLWVPHRQGRPLNDRRQEIRPGHYMDTHFGDYGTGCPDVNIFVRLYPRIENGEEGHEVVLSKDQIREASQINLVRDNEGIIRHQIVKRADLPKGFSCCFSAPINEVIPRSSADQSESANVT
ncbi:hypothetical protein RJ641_024261 [Dillenia turbinata]|uniref:Uncharacterized protein n=1 Tax=Dillenia turbinata TaxID=194707 RepID=A0AAN8YWE9_9MAGN